MQFSKSSEKLCENGLLGVWETEERFGALQDKMAEVQSEQHDAILPQTAASLTSTRSPNSFSGRNRLSGARRETQCTRLRRFWAAGTHR